MKINTYAVNCNDAWLNTEVDDISGSYVKYKDHQAVVAELEAKFAALAAENAALNKFIKDDCLIWDDKSEEYFDAADCMPETPATDAFLAEVRAQGVDMARNAMIDFVDGEIGPNKNVPGLIRGAEICVSIAEQLRKGGSQ